MRSYILMSLLACTVAMLFILWFIGPPVVFIALLLLGAVFGLWPMLMHYFRRAPTRWRSTPPRYDGRHSSESWLKSSDGKPW